MPGRLRGTIGPPGWVRRGTHTGPMILPTGRVPPTGRAVAFDEIRIDRVVDGRVVDGRVVESWFIPDRPGLWQQLDLLA